MAESSTTSWNTIDEINHAFEYAKKGSNQIDRLRKYIQVVNNRSDWGTVDPRVVVTAIQRKIRELQDGGRA